ncbi:hypothetical protein CY34DRAFT_14535 [Suillus luteus UH-Slu-Lm8-n1]|uniref:DUF6532 domain-containing protein n=1 Tax=Suillus luteus UH-Slu-Lm8-n1 TaxID=930992 RepID=A0A0D0AM84_9AGAM|nr:hypothetical protein CY34DRAFT_14535 [Suillus luteus UH-Slu-Lm8-n1]
MSAVERPAGYCNRHPTERAQYISETHKDKENHHNQQVNKTHEHQEKAHQKASKAVKCEAYQNNTGCTPVSAVPLRNDPRFASQTVSIPARDPNLVARKSTVLLALHRLTLITSRGFHLCGEVKTKICPYVANEYKFETSTKQSVINHNIMLTWELKKDFAFVYKTRLPDGNKGLYSAKIIQKGVNTIWFCDKKDKGVLYPEFYKPFPEATVRFQSDMLEYMVEDVERQQDENERLRAENWDIIEEHLQDNTRRISAWHDIQDDLVEYINSIEV